ncbi:MAG: hypothetical protein WAP74_04030 [Patescibacteria group bacterium]
MEGVRMVSAAELATVLSEASSRLQGRPIRFDAQNIERSASLRGQAHEAWREKQAWLEARRARSREKSRRHAANKAARAEMNRQMRFNRGGKAKAKAR